MRGTARESGGGATDASEYEHLRAKKRERRGNVERATVRDVFVGEDEVVVALGFDWTTDTERVVYDLDDDRDLLDLEVLAESKGFDFEHLGLLEGETVDAVYTGSAWIPDARRADPEGEASRPDRSAAASTPSTGSAPVERLAGFVRSMTTRQLIIAVILVKKLLVVALLVWLVL